MSDSPSNLERELLAMRPKALSNGRIHSLMQTATTPSRRAGDWCLMSAMGSGLAAAVVIVVMVCVGMADQSPANRTTTSPPLAQIIPQRAGDSLTAFARADGDWAGFVK
jgi:hypothetical protein